MKKLLLVLPLFLTACGPGVTAHDGTSMLTIVDQIDQDTYEAMVTGRHYMFFTGRDPLEIDELNHTTMQDLMQKTCGEASPQILKEVTDRARLQVRFKCI